MKRRTGPTHFRNAKGALHAICGLALTRGRYQPKWSTRFTGTTCTACRERITRIWGKDWNQ